MKPLLICLLSLPMLAQVRFLPAKKLWVLETGRTSYVLGINEQNSLQNVYWGKKLLRDDDLAPAHTAPEQFTASRTSTGARNCCATTISRPRTPHPSTPHSTRARP